MDEIINFLLSHGLISWVVTIIAAFALFVVLRKLINRILDDILQNIQSILSELKKQSETLNMQGTNVAVMKEALENHESADDKVHEEFGKFKAQVHDDFDRVHSRIDDVLKKTA